MDIEEIKKSMKQCKKTTCLHQWLSRTPEPQECPKCKSRTWREK